MSGSGIAADGPDPVGRLLRGGSIYTLATAAQLGAGVLVLPVLTRILDPTEFGTVTAALVIYNLLGVIIGLGLPTALTRAYFHSDDRAWGREGTLGLVWATGLVAFGLAALLELTGPAWSGIYEDLEYGAPLRLAVFSAAAWAMLQASQGILRAEERAGAFVVGAIVVTAGAQGLGLVGAAIGGVTEYMAGVAIGVAAATGISIYLSGAHRTLRMRGEVVRRNLRIGLPTVPHALALYVLAAGDRIVVERLEGLADLARYHVAFLVGFVVILLGMAINNAWSPIVYGAAEERRWQVLADTTATVLRVGALAAAALAVFAPVALELVAPAGYELGGVDQVTVLVASSALPYIFFLACSHVLLWSGRTLWLAVVTPVIAAINIGLNFALIPPFGLTGAAAATLSSYVLLAAALLVVSRRIVRVPWPWRSAALSGGLIIAVAAIAIALPDDGAWLVARSLAGAAIATGLLWRVRQVATPAGPQSAPAS